MTEETKIKGSAMLFIVCMFLFAVLFKTIPAYASSVTLAWDPPLINSAAVSGYLVHYGASSRVYTESMNVGNSTTATVDSLPAGTWFFAVTAYDTAGNQSAYSNEVSTAVQPSDFIGVYDPSAGFWYLDKNGNGLWDGEPSDKMEAFGRGLTGAIPVTGDWNGDGKTEIGVFINGIWYLDMNGNGQWDGEPTDVMGVFGIGLAGAVPVVGDWNGDGTSEIGVYQDGYWYLDVNRNWAWDGEPTDTLGVFGIGLVGEVPLTGDWNGDGTTEIGVYMDGYWYLDKNRNWAWDGEPTDVMGVFGIGLTGDLPVTGDWNGDGTSEIGIYQDGHWFLDVNRNWAWDGGPADKYGYFGMHGWIPVSGKW